MAKKKITPEKIITAFLFCAFDKSAGATSLADIADYLEIKKASLYNHFESKEDMYSATLDFCREYVSRTKFLPDSLLNESAFKTLSLEEAFSQLIKSYIHIYESEPFFQIFAFIHSEKYFNKIAADIADEEKSKLEFCVSQVILSYCNQKGLELSTVEVDSAVRWYSSAFLQQMDSYIMHKMEIVRQNPECGTGSLFALPTDEVTLNGIYQLSDNYIKLLIK